MKETWRPMKENVASVKYYYSDDEYIHWFECAKCTCHRITYRSNYCPNCGTQLEWSNCDIPKDLMEVDINERNMETN